MKLKLDPNALTFGDLEDFEEACGEPLMDVFERVGEDGTLKGLSMRTMKALMWVCARTDNPDFSLDDVRKMKIGELKDVEVEVVGEADPTPGDG